jgi:FtsP/CotA-like multicopper oxidase with cupredoxin domain
MRAKRSIPMLRYAALGLAVFAAAATAPLAATVFLRAGTVTKAMPDGQVVTFWGFAKDTAFGAGDGTLTVPGPRIVVPPGDTTLDILLDNRLSAPISLVIPGQVGETYYPVGGVSPGVPVVPTWTDGATGPRGGDVTKRVRSFAPETAPNNFALGTGVHYVWTGLKPGTYLYESGTHPSIQVQMGLYGCVTRDFAAGPPGLGYAYSGVQYDNETVLLFSEVDPWLHAAVAGNTYGQPLPSGGDPRLYPSSTIGYRPKYFLINGAAHPTPNVTFSHPPLATERVLLRFLNAGSETHVPELLGAYMSLVSEDGAKYAYPKEQYTVGLSAGKTFDAVLAGSFVGSHALFDRKLGLVNDRQTPGGMIASIPLLDAATLPPRVGDTLMVTKSAGGTSLAFRWGDIPEASTYRIYESATPVPATFSTLYGTASTGLTGSTYPTPAGSLVFFLVAGVNAAGEGPQK